jgi:acetoacetyl-CoA synthetase
VRIGPAEIYRVLDGVAEVADSLVVCVNTPQAKDVMMLFVALRPGVELDEALRNSIRDRLRRAYSPRHVPDEITAVPAVPRTLSGKILEVPVKRILMGAEPAAVASRDSLADPAALDWFVERRTSGG